jgi:hypothetical protein
MAHNEGIHRRKDKQMSKGNQWCGWPGAASSKARTSSTQHKATNADERYGSSTQQEADYQRMLELSSEAMLEGLNRGALVWALLTRIRRDEAYLRYRHGKGTRTRYDEQTEQDLRVLALAACYLEEDGLHLPAEPSPAHAKE